VKVGKPTAPRAPKRRSEPEQLVLFKPRGGKRRRAGRKPKGLRAGSPHKTRPTVVARHPVHVVLRVVAAVGNLRRRFTYRAIREATLTTARREDFRIVHLSIQRPHLHLIVEADHKDALASGMQGFQISAAKHLNAAISRGFYPNCRLIAGSLTRTCRKNQGEPTHSHSIATTVDVHGRSYARCAGRRSRVHSWGNHSKRAC